MARSKTIYISGTGKPKPGQGIKVWGPRKKYSSSKRNYSTTDRATFTARVVREVELEESYGDKNFLYGFVNVYQELYRSMYYNILTRMYEEIMIKSYSCNISLDSSSTLVNPNTPQTVFYIAQDRNGIPYEGGAKKPQDYASVRSMPINFYSPFKTWAGLSVSGIQESSSFISCDLFKPNTGLFGVTDSTGLIDDENYCYSQNQTYSQFMFKPVILMAVKNLNNAKPVFVCEFKFNIVGRGIRAVQNEPSNITADNAATGADIRAGKIAFSRSGETLNGTMISPITSTLSCNQNTIYTVGELSGGYPVTAASTINVSVPIKIPVLNYVTFGIGSSPTAGSFDMTQLNWVKVNPNSPLFDASSYVDVGDTKVVALVVYNQTDRTPNWWTFEAYSCYWTGAVGTVDYTLDLPDIEYPMYVAIIKQSNINWGISMNLGFYGIGNNSNVSVGYVYGQLDQHISDSSRGYHGYHGRFSVNSDYIPIYSPPI